MVNEWNEGGNMMVKGKISSTLVIILLVFSLLTNTILFGPVIMFGKANPGNINQSWYNGTTLNVTVLHLEPRINWYDIQYNQSGAWVSRRNQQIDVNNSAEYRFIVNISSDQGWDDIDYINITAWYDNGSESTIYNQTQGGNLNFCLTYENLSGTAFYNMTWPDDEVTIGTLTESVGTDPTGSPVYTECYNISFTFIPGYQLRHAPGDGLWDNTTNITNDVQSWNFNVTVTDGGEGAPTPITCNIVDEFGIYAYAEVASAGWPTIVGNPGENVTATSNITVAIRSNGNYSLSVDVDQLNHTVIPTANISNETVWVRGGDLDVRNNFTGSGPIYFYGSAVTYHVAEDNNLSKSTSDVEYRCDIPLGQHEGEYTATIHYYLRTQT